MILRQLLVCRQAEGDSGAGPLWIGPSAAVFTAPQSLVAFSACVCIIVTAARAARTIFHFESDSVGVPLLAALTAGAVVFTVAVTDPVSRPRGLTQWISAVAVALVNSLVLFAAALGIEKF